MLRNVLIAKPTVVFLDKYGGAEFTQPELVTLGVQMLQTDGKEATDRFFERFVFTTSCDELATAAQHVALGIGGAQ